MLLKFHHPILSFFKNNFLKKNLLLLFVAISFSFFAQSQSQVLNPRDAIKCKTSENIKTAIQSDPTLISKWKIEGERIRSLSKYKSIQRLSDFQDEIIIPVVFHIVDVAANQNWVSDRDIYTQLEILNDAYGGKKVEKYRKVIPKEMWDLVGRVKIKFVLAKRKPNGTLTSGIERRVFKTPSYKNIKNSSKGGIDPWDVSKYINIWVGTFSGADEGLLGIATPPFYTSDGPQGVVIGTATIPYSTNVQRGYYASYNEGATLVHELGHYFYLWHTFGDMTTCNNDDFWTQSGWDLPNGAGPEGDDTPEEKDGGNATFGNPSQNYSDGCTNLSYGEMYGSFMNYFDDRALFMFSKGHIKRVEGCIELYRPGLINSDGAVAPIPVNDAYLVSVTPYGSPLERQYLINNTPLKATIRNYGTTILNSVTVSVKVDNGVAQNFFFDNLNLGQWKDTILSLGVISGTSDQHTLTIYTSLPNQIVDQFTHNDTLQSFIAITGGNINAPFTENFAGSTFPPNAWQIWNPQNNTTWSKSTTSGYSQAGAATVQSYSYNGVGELNELISPAIEMGTADSSLITFKVAYAITSGDDVSVWDGLEVYISNNGGISYDLAYKKTGNYLTTVGVQSAAFSAPPSSPDRWRTETINLTPYIIHGQKLLIKFRHVNAYGNNLYLDDVHVSSFTQLHRDALPVSILNLPDLICEETISPKLVFSTNGHDVLQQLKINYQIDGGNVFTQNWSGNLVQSKMDTITLQGFPTLSPGRHLITIYTSAPNNLDDQNVSNDTISKSFFVIGNAITPLSEGFENVQFPPNNWGVSQNDPSINWERTTVAAASGIASMVIRNFDANTSANHQFISPKITGNPAYDSLFVSFDYAYGTSLQSPTGTDTLEILSTSDCGKTYTSLWKKWGADLQTVVGGWNTPTPFVPGAKDWKNVNLFLTPIVNHNDFQLIFVARSNHQNNLYVDNINIYGKTVPERLKKLGYLIYPSPFRDQLIIRNYEQPVNLQGAAIYNFSGQKIWSMEFNGTAQKEIYVDMKKYPAGIYTVRLVYSDKTVSERVVKQ